MGTDQSLLVRRRLSRLGSLVRYWLRLWQR